MVVGVESVILSSENPRTLAEFYEKKVGLKLTTEFEMGEKNEVGFTFEMKGCSLYILHHSKVKGKNNSPERVMFNLETNNIENDFEKLKKSGATVIKETYHMESYGFIATFADPDNNYFQLVQVREPEHQVN